MEKDYSPTPYDDVFRTLLVECSKLIIPVINEVFGEHYTGDEKILFSPNEHFLGRQGGEESKRITDSSFQIIGAKETKRYHLECESTVDFSILVRIFEYDTQIALDQDSEVIENRIIVTFPNTAILFLRSHATTPDQMEIVIRTPGGEISYDVPVMKVLRYRIEDIFAKKLLFLIPFYIFTYESRFQEINGSEEKLNTLITEYRGIRSQVEQLTQTGVIDEYYKQAILDMSERVIKHLARRFEHIQEGVGAVMGGQVIEFEAKVIRDKALEEGLEQGREENHEQEMVSGIQRAMNKLNMTLDKAMEFMDIPEADQPRYALLLKESETNFDYNS